MLHLCHIRVAFDDEKNGCVKTIDASEVSLHSSLSKLSVDTSTSRTGWQPLLLDVLNLSVSLR